VTKHIEISNVKLSEIKPYENNPRFVENAIESVARSIEEFGFNQPIVLDGENTIIVGHVRYYALLKLGYDEAPCYVANHLTAEQVAKYRLADNKSSELAGWDDSKLWEEIQKLEFSSDLCDFGFNVQDLAKSMLADQNEDDITLPELDGVEDDLVSLESDVFTKVGDVYEIGVHRLVCGDSTELSSYKSLFKEGLDHYADLIFTDPPYNVNYEGGTKEKLKIKNDSMKANEFKQFLLCFYFSAFQFSKEGASIYVCFAESEGLAFRQMMLKAGWQLKQCLVWVKNQIVMGRSDYHYQHEPILYGWKAGESHKWLGDRKQSTVWKFDKPQKNEEHPTMKPVALVEKALLNSSKRNDVVLDPFGGSGTTLVACEKQRRTGRMIEIDPKYCDVIIKRMVKLFPSIVVKRNGSLCHHFKTPQCQ
jgi:DNA modification methylase